MSDLIGNAFIDPPYHYEVGEVVNIRFRTEREVLEKVLPSVLKVPDGPTYAVMRIVNQVRSTFGGYVGVYFAAFAQFGEQRVLHGLTGMKTNFSGTVAGRDVWGMPLQVGDASLTWGDNDVLNIVAGRNGVDFVRASVRLGRRTEAPTDAARLTYASRKRVFDQDPKRNLLLGVQAERDPAKVQHWTASSVLKILGGEPGDDWSIFPVFEVVETQYSVGGTSALLGATVLAEW